MNQKLQEFYSRISGRNIAVIGIGVSNTPLIRLLTEHGAHVTACDKKEKAALGEVAEELEALGVSLRLGEGYLDELNAELVFKTPGMRFDHPALEKARAAGAVVTSEMEVFFELCPCRLIAVTGSDGKSTTTTLIARLLEAAGYTVHLGGNLGRPLLPDIEKIKEEDLAVLELSSFQLHTMKKSPHIAVVTNLSPNHLDVHRSMEEYVDAKRNIYAYQGEEDLLVVNADNSITASFAPLAKGRVRTFGSCEGNCLYTDETHNILHNGNILLRRDEVLLPGDHNIENYMAAICAVRDLVPMEAIRRVAGSFQGLEHRLELVRTLNGVRYYNDSIASSPTRTIACLNSFDQKLILLLGGYDKHIPFDTLGEALCGKAKAVVLVGATADAIETAIRSASGFETDPPVIFRKENMEDAVAAARSFAVPGDVVVLSPACASFDLYKNFMERGHRFKRCVAALEEV